MMKTKDTCPILGCGLPAEFVRYVCEEILMPIAMKESDLERKPPFGVVGRNFVVRCEVHGERVTQVEGHHITHIPKKSRKKPPSQAN